MDKPPAKPAARCPLGLDAASRSGGGGIGANGLGGTEARILLDRQPQVPADGGELVEAHETELGKAQA